MSEAAEALTGEGGAAPQGQEGDGQQTTEFSLPEEYGWLGDGATEDTLALAQQKGWNSPVDIAQGYSNVEKMVGGRIKIPEAGDADGWNDLWSKLGRPEDTSGYDFGEIPEGMPSANVEWFREIAHSAGLNNQQAAPIVQGFIERQNAEIKQFEEQKTQQFNTEMSELRGEWGQQFDANMQMARQGTAALGLTKEDLEAIEDRVGPARIFKMMQGVGSKIGEASFEDGGGSNNFGVMSPAQAQSEYDTLMSSNDFKQRYLSGDPSAVNQVNRLMASMG
jgi:hypothetical protein